MRGATFENDGTVEKDPELPSIALEILSAEIAEEIGTRADRVRLIRPAPKLRGVEAVLRNAKWGKKRGERDGSSLTQGQIAEQAARGDSARGRAAYLVQQQVRRVLFEADRHADVVDAEEAAAGE